MNLTKEELIRLYWKEGKSLIQISRELGIKRPETIRQQMIKYGIPRRRLYISNPKLNPSPSLAYIIGVYFGDGSIVVGGKRVSLIFRLECSQKEFVNSLAEALRKINTKPKVWSHTRYMKKTNDHRTYWLCDAYSTKLCKFLKSLTVAKLRDLLKEREAIKEFVRGFYESEGSFGIYANSRVWKLKMSNIHKEILLLTRECCEKLGIKGWHIYEFKDKRNPKWSTIYDLVLYRKDEIRKFFSIIDPVIKNPFSKS